MGDTAIYSPPAVSPRLHVLWVPLFDLLCSRHALFGQWGTRWMSCSPVLRSLLRVEAHLGLGVLMVRIPSKKEFVNMLAWLAWYCLKVFQLWSARMSQIWSLRPCTVICKSPLGACAEVWLSRSRSYLFEMLVHCLVCLMVPCCQ